MTTQQTTYRFGALGNSGLGSGEERGFPSGKGRKKLFFAESAFIGPFGMLRPQVRALSLRPSRGYKKDIVRENPDFIGVFTVLYGKISAADFVDIKKVFSLCKRF